MTALKLGFGATIVGTESDEAVVASSLVSLSLSPSWNVSGVALSAHDL